MIDLASFGGAGPVGAAWPLLCLGVDGGTGHGAEGGSSGGYSALPFRRAASNAAARSRQL